MCNSDSCNNKWYDFWIHHFSFHPIFFSAIIIQNTVWWLLPCLSNAYAPLKKWADNTTTSYRVSNAPPLQFQIFVWHLKGVEWIFIFNSWAALKSQGWIETSVTGMRSNFFPSSNIFDLFRERYDGNSQSKRNYANPAVIITLAVKLDV